MLESAGVQTLVNSTTIEMVVPDDLIGAVLGPRKATLQGIMSASGAFVIVSPRVSGGSAEGRKVTITGSAGEAAAAESLVKQGG